MMANQYYQHIRVSSIVSSLKELYIFNLTTGLLSTISALDLASWALDLDEGLITLDVAGAGIQFTGPDIDCQAFTIINDR